MERNIKTVVKSKCVRLLAGWSKLRVISSEVVLQIPAGTAWTKRLSSKKAGDIHEGMEGCFDMVSQWGEIRL